MKYSQEQFNYIQAKIQFDAIDNEVKRIVAERKLKETCASRKEYGEKLREIENSLGYTSALSNMIEAEQKLINWAHEVVKRDPNYSDNKSDMERLFQKYYFHTEIKNKIIDLALKLELSTNTLNN
ncbi:hypothetical protein EDM57_05060 [Brevibacillus gelatini]|uniref:Uncharacterized protein n=1 Tax=Brevibacillus gelatini TaxID=1655277 RepID=A0A3M8B882_9BACL|nr:hypothetical protein [Brevibacillus gelatini]RNB59512.1 hypothetical protein EDM57_05060 [Brevibacillus gelatini]